MRRNYLTDVVLLLFALGLSITGGLLWGNGVACARSSPFRRKWVERQRAPWLTVHRVFSLVFVAATIMHLLWHWGWIRECTPRVIHGEK